MEVHGNLKIQNGDRPRCLVLNMQYIAQNCKIRTMNKTDQLGDPSCNRMKVMGNFKNQDGGRLPYWICDGVGRITIRSRD